MSHHTLTSPSVSPSVCHVGGHDVVPSLLRTTRRSSKAVLTPQHSQDVPLTEISRYRQCRPPPGILAAETTPPPSRSSPRPVDTSSGVLASSSSHASHKHAPGDRQTKVAIRPKSQLNHDPHHHPVVAETKNFVLLATQDGIQKDSPRSEEH